mmetsp:Transcript_16987/g.35659  ORF Transcript_16987/g.35659 Transcript_16987/m.35659 type:complete len:1640 (+) Transcript_16987:59-4978(+)
MIFRGREHIPALLFVAVLLYGRSIRPSLTVSADEPVKEKSKSGLSLSEIFSSIYGDKSKPDVLEETKTSQTVQFTKEEFTSFINQWQQQQQHHQQQYPPNVGGNDQDASFGSYHTFGQRRKAYRRRVLYELSVQAHYEQSLKKLAENDLNGGIDDPKNFMFGKIDETDIPADEKSCVFYNEYLESIGSEEIENAESPSIYSRFSYWTYKLCRGKSISQIHLQPLPTSIEDDAGKQANTDDSYINSVGALGLNSHNSLKLPPKSVYSGKTQFYFHTVHDLGQYLPPSTPDYKSLIISAWGPKEKIHNIPHEDIEYYIDGESCIYTPEEPNLESPKATKRQSKVVYEDDCCKRSHRTMEEFFEQKERIRILSITEPKPCRYVLLACRYCLKSDVTDEESPFNRPKLSSNAIDRSAASILLRTYLQSSPADSDDDSFNHLPPMPPSQIEANKQLLRDMFSHAFDSYIYNAFPASELHPITCKPGEFHLVRLPALTLIDTLDTLIIMRNFTEFARSVERLRFLDLEMKREFNRTFTKSGKGKKREDEVGGLFAVNQDVSLFETTIRVLGGLLSAHQLAEAFMADRVTVEEVWDSYGEILLGNSTRSNYPIATESHTELDREDGLVNADETCRKFDVSDIPSPHKESSFQLPCNETTTHWIYDGFLLSLAQDIGSRLLCAFETDTGIPYGTVNLLYGVPKDETPVASLAGAGTLTLEFELLSRLTGEGSFGEAAKLATRALWTRRSLGLNLFGKHINTKSGQWTEYLSGIGSNSDSFYEYLIKHYLLFPDDSDFWLMFVIVYSGVWENNRLGDWYADIDMNHGLDGHVRQVFESLMAFYPGMQVLLGELTPSAKTLNSFFLVREFLGLLPERFNFVHWKTESGGDIHPLRPELLESCYFLHLATIGLQGSDCGPCSKTDSNHRTSTWLWAADFALQAVSKLAWTPCGFATVKKVGPTTTGMIDGDFVKINSDVQAEQKRLKIKHHDEMPSFFLSETIKYLYLTFDAEDNLLHTDSERDWIFTTEAHPIHHVPKVAIPDGPSSTASQTTDINDLGMEMEKIRSLLRSGRNKFAPNNYDPIENSYSNHFETAQWALKTAVADFSSDIQDAENEVTFYKRKSVEGRSHVVGPLFRSRLLQHTNTMPMQGIFSSDNFISNLARDHFDHIGKGNGAILGKSCPNFHHPDLIWPRALHSSIDYSTTHSSSTSFLPTAVEGADARMSTALASVCFHGTDYHHDGISVDQSRSCSVEEGPTKQHFHPQRSTKTRTASTAPIPGSTRYDMGGDLGKFDVSSFSNGDGFIVRHVASGERLDVSIFYDFAVNEIGEIEMSEEAIILVVLTVPNTLRDDINSTRDPHTDHIVSSLSYWKSKGESWKHNFSGGNMANDFSSGKHGALFDYNQHVIIADMNSHSYSCSVILTRLESRNYTSARFPCSPALFGKARLESLVENGGIIVEGSLNAPRKDDETGCDVSENNLDNLEDFCVLPSPSNSTVQMVERGKCNFLRKAKNQRVIVNADAIIVINSEPHELFVMANEMPSGQLEGPCTSDDAPVSVLITKNDGNAIIHLLKEEQSKGNDVTVSIQLIEQESDDDVPYVKGTQEALQVFATEGWGVHAVRQVVNNHGDKKSDTSSPTWQLFIMQHSQS